MSEPVDAVADIVSRSGHPDPCMITPTARAAIEAVFAWLANPSEAAVTQAYRALGREDGLVLPDEVWTAMLAQMKKVALG